MNKKTKSAEKMKGLYAYIRDINKPLQIWQEIIFFRLLINLTLVPFFIQKQCKNNKDFPKFSKIIF